MEDEFFGRIHATNDERVDIDPENIHLPQVQNFQAKKKKPLKSKKRNEAGLSTQLNEMSH